MKATRGQSTLYGVFIILFCILGLSIKTGILGDGFKGYTLIYFTNQSNILVLVIYLLQTVFKFTRKNDMFNFLYGLALMNILTTFFVYVFILAPSSFNMYGADINFDFLGSMILHFIVPLTVLVDFISDKNYSFKFSYVIFWLLFLLLYFIFLVIQAKIGGFIPNQNTKYPYNFVAVDLYGWKRVIINCGFIAIFYSIISAAIVAVSRIKKKPFNIGRHD